MNAIYKPIITKQVIDDSHYYFVDGEYVPGVTTILHETLPTAPQLRQWIGDLGSEKAQARMEVAADRGTRIHQACEDLLRARPVNLKRDFPKYDEKKCITSFVDWVNVLHPTVVSPDHIEMVVASKAGFAGTLDLFCIIENEPWIVDFKTTSGIYDSHKLQLIAYQQAYLEMTGVNANVGILHLNHKTKKGWTFMTKMEIGGRPLEFGDFMKVFEVYKVLNGGVIRPVPLRTAYPEILTLYEQEDVWLDKSKPSSVMSATA